MTSADFDTILPLAVLTGWACVLLLIDLLIPRGRKGITALLAALGLLVTLGLTLFQWGTQRSGFNGMVVRDGFSGFVNALLAVSGLLGIALAYGYIKRMPIDTYRRQGRGGRGVIASDIKEGDFIQHLFDIDMDVYLFFYFP